MAGTESLHTVWCRNRAQSLCSAAAPGRLVTRRGLFLAGPSSRAWALLLAVVLMAGPLAGCLGDDGETDGNEPSLPQDGFKVFLAALGATGPATARLDNVGVAVGDATQFLQTSNETFDLADLSDSGQALLVAAEEGVSGTVTNTVLVFAYLDVGTENLTNARLEVPFEYPADEEVEVTVTLDVNATAAAGAPRLANLVADRGTERIAQVTGAELGLDEREELPPLPKPRVVARAAGGNDTAPSFEVNAPIAFSFELPGVAPGDIREVFWTFSDGTTTTGLEVEHTFRQAGPATASVVVEAARGQQTRNGTALDIYWTTSGEGNIAIGSGGADAVEGRDFKLEPLDVPGPLTAISVRVTSGPSGNLCEGPLGCAPSNLFIELMDPEGNSLGANTTDADVKYVNVTQALPGGEFVLKVSGDEGAAVGYRFFAEAHYIGLCPGAGNATAAEGNSTSCV